jgi:hypothetical protein
MALLKWNIGVPSAFAIGMFLSGQLALAAEPTPLDPQQFAKLHVMLKPQRGEARWMEIDWYPNVWEARQKAAAEGKPIFIMAGSGGAPAAGC